MTPLFANLVFATAAPQAPPEIERMAKAIVAASWTPNPVPVEDVEAIWTAVPEAERANARRLAKAAYDAL